MNQELTTKAGVKLSPLSPVKAAIFPLICKGISVNHIGFSIEMIERLQISGKCGEYRENQDGDMAVFAKGHRATYLVPKGDYQRAQSEDGKGSKRCPICQKWAQAERTKGRGKSDNSFQALKSIVAALAQAETTKEENPDLDKASVQELDNLIEYGQIERARILDEHPEYGEKLAKAGV